VVAIEYADGIVFLADNPSTHLRKISEIYDRIAFAAVGKYSEFESLRIGGIQLADVRGYSYGREDVAAKTLANAYSQVLSMVFTQQLKPYEVEILVGEVGERPEENSMFHILFDGSVSDKEGFVAMGGQSEALTERLKEAYKPGLDLASALKSGVEAITAASEENIEPARIEAAVLDRTRPRRRFRRLSNDEVVRTLGG
jgi:proteasome alpha subunit